MAENRPQKPKDRGRRRKASPAPGSKGRPWRGKTPSNRLRGQGRQER